MADAPEVYHQPPGQQSAFVANTGPHYGGPHPESEGLQVNGAYNEFYNKAPYPNDPNLGKPQQYVQNQPGGYIQPGGYVQPAGYVQPSPYPNTQYPPQEDTTGKKKRICGLSVLAFWCIVVAVILIIIGAVVGGVVGSKKAKESKQSNNSAQDQNGGGGNDIIPTTSSVPTTTSFTTTETTASSTTSSSPTPTSAFEEDSFYRLSNQYLGRTSALDILNLNGTASRQLNMSTTGDHQGQFWQLTEVPNSSSTYWFSNLFLGKEIRMTVDPLDRVNPLMEDADDTLDGQKWIVASNLDGTWLIHNGLGGSASALSTYSDTHRLFMDTQDDSGIYWSIAKIRKILPEDNYN